MGSSGTPQGSKTPKWAGQILDALVNYPMKHSPELYSQFLGGGGTPFGDVVAGFGAAPSPALFGPFGGMLGPFGDFSQQAAQLGGPMALNAALGSQGYANMAGPFAQYTANMGALSPNFMEATFPFYNQLKDLVGKGGELEKLVRESGGPFSGQAAGRALGMLKDTGPDSELYQRTLGLLTPQTRAAFAARGMGGSGAAIKEEANQAQQLADQFAQRAVQERTGLLQQAVGGEQANAAMTGALSSLLGSRAGALQAGIQGALGGITAPGQVFGQHMGAFNQGLQNLAAAQGLNLGPLQALGAGAQSLAGLTGPLTSLYQATRSPYLQLLQAAAGASPLQKASQYWSPLGIPKG